MAKDAPKFSVSTTSGANKPVNNIIKFEDLVKQLKEGAPAAARKMGGGKAVHRDQISAIQQLATDLEQRLRAVRRTVPNPAAPAARRKPKS